MSEAKLFNISGMEYYISNITMTNRKFSVTMYALDEADAEKAFREHCDETGRSVTIEKIVHVVHLNSWHDLVKN